MCISYTRKYMRCLFYTYICFPDLFARVISASRRRRNYSSGLENFERIARCESYLYSIVPTLDRCAYFRHSRMGSLLAAPLYIFISLQFFYILGSYLFRNLCRVDLIRFFFLLLREVSANLLRSIYNMT